MKYVSQGPLLVDVHMHRPHTNSKNFMDSLLAFWPGLQVRIPEIIMSRAKLLVFPEKGKKNVVMCTFLHIQMETERMFLNQPLRTSLSQWMTLFS
jgi:hypothetical protein